MEYAAMAPTTFKVKDRYTNADIAGMVRELHTCVHQGNLATEAIRSDLLSHRQEVQGSLTGLGQRLTQVETLQEERRHAHLTVEKRQSELLAGLSRLEGRLGTDPSSPVQKKAWFPAPWQLAATVLGCITGGVVVLRIMILVAPHLVDAIMKVGI